MAAFFSSVCNIGELCYCFYFESSSDVWRPNDFKPLIQHAFSICRGDSRFIRVWTNLAQVGFIHARAYGFKISGTMLLRGPAIVSTTVAAAISPWGRQDGHANRVAENCKLGLAIEGRKNRGSRQFCPTIRAMAAQSSNSALTGVIFEPFAEVQSELVHVSQSFTQSLARQRFSASCEAALNEQINVEYNVSYIYHALFAYFDRDNVGLPGFAKYFKEASDEERLHAEMLMKYQNLRGGRVKLQSIVMPVMEFDNAEKGDALYAMELALSLEKLTNEKLLNLHSVAQESNDGQMTDYLEGTFLAEQVAAIKRVAEYVAQLRRVGRGHGVWHFDRMLLEGQEAVADAVPAGGGAAAA